MIVNKLIIIFYSYPGIVSFEASNLHFIFS